MTRRALFVPAVLAVVATTGSLLAGSAGAGARSPVYVQVVEKEFSLTLSRLKVPRGTVILQAINFGMDNHDLVVQGTAKGSKPIKFRMMAPNERITKTLKLPAGRYTLFCSIPGHRAQGMVARLTVG